MIKTTHIFRWVLAIGLGVLVVGTLAVAGLRSRALHRYLLAKMMEQASHATGGRVEIGNFRFRWSGLRVDLDNIVLHGTETASRPPLLQIDHLMVGLKIISLWRRKINLNEIVIDRPSIHTSVDRDGHSNLPQVPQTAPGSQPTNVFDLAIGHFVINQGELEYNDRHILLEGEVHDLHAQVTYSSAKGEYSGTVEYRNGRFQLGSFNPVQHDAQAHFGATASGLTLSSLALHAGSSTISLQAHLRDYDNPSIDTSFQAALSTGEIGRIVNVASIPAGLVNLEGMLHYQNRPNHPLLDNLSVAGQFHSPALALDLPQARTRVQALTGEYRLSGGAFEARNVKADVLGGKIAGDLTLTELSRRPVARVAAEVNNVSLQAISAAMDVRPLERTAISGRLNGTIAGSWEGSGENGQFRSDATLSASVPVQPAATGGTEAIPLEGVLHLAYDARLGMITLRSTELATSHLTVKLDGSTGKQSSLGIQAQSNDLSEIDQLVLIVRNALEGGRSTSPTTIAPLGIGGSVSFDGQLRGSLADLHLGGHLSSNQLQYRATTLTQFRVNVDLSPSEATLSQGELQTSDGGRVQYDADAVLQNWAYAPQSPVRLDVTAAGVHIAPLMQLANLPYPVTGTLGVHISIHGSQSGVMGQGSVTLTRTIAWGQPIQNLSIQLQGEGKTIQSTLQFSTPAGSGSGKLSYNFSNQGYDAQISILNIQLERLEAIQHKNVEISGIATASLQGRGTLNDPQFTATLQSPQLFIGHQTINGLLFHAEVAHQQATFTLDSAAQGASIQARGAISLNANYSATANLDVRNIQVGPLLAAFLPHAPAELRGQTELHASLHGPLKQQDQIEAEADIPSVTLTYQSLQIGNASPIHAVYHSGVVSLEKCELKGTGTDLQVQATIPLESIRDLQAKATGTLDLHLIQLLNPDWVSSGQLSLDVDAEGTFTHPAIHGTVRLTDAAFQAPDTPLGAEKVNAVFIIRDGRLEIQSFTGEAGGGSLVAKGFAAYQPTAQFNVTLTAKKIRLRYPVGTRSILDGNLVLTGSGGSAILSGQVLVSSLSLTKEFDLSTFADQFTESSSASLGSTFAQNVKLNVSLKSASEMALASGKLRVQGSADLMVRGTAADPVILGRSNITEGEIFFNGNRFQLQNGVIQFVNPVRTEPVVNILVTTTVNQFNISMNFSGPIDRMHTSYTSDPPLAPVDIINLLSTGQTTEAASTGSTTPESVIAGQLTSQLSSRVEKLAGITSLTIDPQVGSTQGNGGGRLAVQQRVTKNLFFTFSTDLRTSTGQIVQVEYQVSQRFGVSTIRDQNGGYTLQIKVHKSF